MAISVDHSFMRLSFAICMSLSVKYLFMTFAHFLHRSFVCFEFVAFYQMCGCLNLSYNFYWGKRSKFYQSSCMANHWFNSCPYVLSLRIGHMGFNKTSKKAIESKYLKICVVKVKPRFTRWQYQVPQGSSNIQKRCRLGVPQWWSASLTWKALGLIPSTRGKVGTNVYKQEKYPLIIWHLSQFSWESR